MLNKLFGTSTLIEDAYPTVQYRKFWLVSLIFFLIYMVGTTISSIVLIIPMVIWMFANPDILRFVLSNSSSDEAIAELTGMMPDWLTLLTLFATAGTIAAVLVYCLLMEKRSAFSLGFHKKGAVAEYAVGLGIGLAMFGAVYAIMLASGEIVDVEFNPNLSVVSLVLFFLGFVVQGASEELLLRSFYLVSGSIGGGVPCAVFASSALFALLHIGNPGISLLAIVNLFLFGVFAALYFLRRGSVWGIAAIHTIWNFSQGNLFGCKVSGMGMGGSVLVSTASEVKSAYTGGAFGPEGGLGVTIVLVVGIAVLLCMKNKQRIRET